MLGSRALYGAIRGRNRGKPELEVVKDTYEAFGQGDAPRLLGMMTDDAEWLLAPNMPYKPRPRAVHNRLPRLSSARSSRTYPTSPRRRKEFYESADGVAVAVRYRGTGKATGKSLDLGVAHVYDLRDGKVSRFRQFIDTVAFLDVVGAQSTAAA